MKDSFSLNIYNINHGLDSLIKFLNRTIGTDYVYEEKNIHNKWYATITSSCFPNVLIQLLFCNRSEFSFLTKDSYFVVGNSQFAFYGDAGGFSTTIEDAFDKMKFYVPSLQKWFGGIYNAMSEMQKSSDISFEPILYLQRLYPSKMPETLHPSKVWSPFSALDEDLSDILVKDSRRFGALIEYRKAAKLKAMQPLLSRLTKEGLTRKVLTCLEPNGMPVLINADHVVSIGFVDIVFNNSLNVEISLVGNKTKIVNIKDFAKSVDVPYEDDPNLPVSMINNRDPEIKVISVDCKDILRKWKALQEEMKQKREKESCSNFDNDDDDLSPRLRGFDDDE